METTENIQDNTFKLRFSYYIEAKTTLKFLEVRKLWPRAKLSEIWIINLKIICNSNEFSHLKGGFKQSTPNCSVHPLYIEVGCPALQKIFNIKKSSRKLQLVFRFMKSKPEP